MWIIIGSILIFLIITLNLFTYVLGIKLDLLEKNIITIFNKRNNQVVSIFQVSKLYLTKTDEIFNEFFNLKRKDFGENSFNTSLSNKLNTYKKIHNEIDFIFKVCEKNNKIQLNPIFLYLKDSILDKSNDIGKNLKLFNNIKKEYNLYKKISKFTILGLFIK
ncbi:MAG: hypothetical protein PHH98_00490 [Candidatus Gracilibacteria bacterium]|nr:hypothetical protein [Candidatus Gracilibacteria bacterium]